MRRRIPTKKSLFPMGKGHLITCLAALLLCVALVQPAVAGVTVYAEGAYDDTELDLYIYADIDTTAILSFGVRVEYPSELTSPSATKNEDVWFFGDGAAEYAYMEPEINSGDNNVIIIGGKLDTSDPTAGVIGDRVLLGTVTFSHSGMSDDSLPTITLTYGRGDGSTAYQNFVETDGDELDGSDVSFTTIEIHQRGDANASGEITGADLSALKNYLVHGGTPHPWMDCNAAGGITGADLSCIKYIITH